MRRKISIVGAGPAGFAIAADLESRGIKTLVYSHPEHTRHADNVIKRRCLESNGLIQVKVYPHITFDMAKLVGFSNIIIITVPSSGQETILQEFKQFDLSKHTIIAVPGNLFALIAGAVGVETADIFETNLSPYSCRMNEQGQLHILGRKRLVSTASFRNEMSVGVKDKIESIFPEVRFKWCTNILEVSLTNINGSFHPLMVLMNAGRIENTEGDFFFYRDGLTPSVANTITAVDNVRVKVGQAFGFPMKSVTETSNECYGHTFTDLVDLAQNSGPHRNLKAPPDLRNRNISEDVADLLVTWHGLAEKLGFDASPLAAVAVLAGMATGVDYMREGRNLRKLRLDHLSAGELIRRFGTPQHSSRIAEKVILPKYVNEEQTCRVYIGGV